MLSDFRNRLKASSRSITDAIAKKSSHFESSAESNYWNNVSGRDQRSSAVLRRAESKHLLCVRAQKTSNSLTVHIYL